MSHLALSRALRGPVDVEMTSGRAGWMLDGFPRTGPQAQHLLQAESEGSLPQLVVVINVPDEEVVKQCVMHAAADWISEFVM